MLPLAGHNMLGCFSRPATACCAVALALLVSVSVANPVHHAPNAVIDLLPRQTITPGGRPCGQNNATNRGCWKNSWNISTDYEVTTPPAFNTRTVCCCTCVPWFRYSWLTRVGTV